MLISISSASEPEIKKFNKKAWGKANLEHYGRGAKWVSKTFILKAKAQGKIIGTLKAKYDAGVVYVQQLIVIEDKRRLGVGRMLLQELEKRSKRLGAHKLFLFTGHNWEAGRFYEKMGFERTAKLPKHYFKKEFVIYSKPVKAK